MDAVKFSDRLTKQKKAEISCTCEQQKAREGSKEVNTKN